MPRGSEARIKQLEAELARSAERLQAMAAEHRALEATVADLKLQLFRSGSDQRRVGLDAFTTSVAGLLERSQSATESGSAGPVAATLQSVDLEIRGFVELQGNVPHVVLPRAGDVVDAGALSLVRMSFATMPSLPASGAPGGGAPAKPR
jgi:hypothetical protein